MEAYEALPAQTKLWANFNLVSLSRQPGEQRLVFNDRLASKVTPRGIMIFAKAPRDLEGRKADLRAVCALAVSEDMEVETVGMSRQPAPAFLQLVEK